MADPLVTIVLVTYHGADNLAALYAGIERLRYPRDRYRLVVVENGPDREAVGWFRAHAADAQVLVPGVNTGYAGGNALGMEAALATGTDYVAVVTQDTSLAPDWLRELVAVAERNPGAGAVQPKILRQGPHGDPVIHTRGNRLHFLGIGYVGGDGQPDGPLEVQPIPYASGAGVLYRAESLRRVGLFDPAMFMYHEDTDLSWRLRLAGEEVLLAPRAVMRHEYEFSRNAAKLYWIERNRLTNLLTHYRLRTLALFAPALLLLEAASLAYACRGGWLRRRLAVYGFLLRPATWRYLRTKRRQVQGVRRVPDRAVAVHLTGRIDVPGVAGGVGGRLLNFVLGAYWAVARRLLLW